MAVLDAQHFRAIGVVAPALAPQLGRLERRHQHFLRAGAVLLLAHDLLDLLEHAKAERQPGVDAGRGLAHEPGAEHQLVADDLGVGRAFLEDGEEGSGPAHGAALYGAASTAGNRGGRCGRSATGCDKSRQRPLTHVTPAPSGHSVPPSFRTNRPLGRGSERGEAYWGGIAATTSKGADEQSSRKAPGSLADPGVCFASLARICKEQDRWLCVGHAARREQRKGGWPCESA